MRPRVDSHHNYETTIAYYWRSGYIQVCISTFKSMHTRGAYMYIKHLEDILTHQYLAVYWLTELVDYEQTLH